VDANAGVLATFQTGATPVWWMEESSQHKVVAKQNRSTTGKHAKNARSISLPSLRQNDLVAMATFLHKLEKKYRSIIYT